MLFRPLIILSLIFTLAAASSAKITIPLRDPQDQALFDASRALVSAARRGETFTLNALLSGFPNLDKDQVAHAFIWAARDGQLEAVKYLESVDIEMKDLELAFLAAIESKKIGIITYFVQKHAEMLPRHFNCTFKLAAEEGDIALFEYLLDTRLDSINDKDIGDAFNVAAINGQINVVEILLENFSSRIEGQIFDEAVKNTATYGTISTLEYLLASPQAKAEAAGEALILALQLRKTQIAQFIIEERYYIDSYMFAMALQIADQKGYTDILKLLMSRHP